MLSFGKSLGFADGQTLQHFINSGSNPIVTVSAAVYDAMPLAGTVTRLIKDDAGKVYLVENGVKRWILQGSYINRNRPGVPITYLEGTTMNLIPTGAVISQP